MSTISDAPTIAPNDSASMVTPAKPNTVTPQAKKGRRPAKSAVDKAAPPGATEVPPAGKDKTNKKSQVISGTIPLSGWGDVDLSSHRREVLPRHTVDANPYFDLVDATYMNMYGGFSNGSKHIPFSLFRYYCSLLWWHRTLYLCRSNAVVLTSSEKDAFNVLNVGEEFQIPAPIAQYLANMGNFQAGGETFYFEKLSGQFTGTWDSEDATVEKGWLSTTSGITVNDSESFWRYAQLPVPAVFALSIQAEAAHVTNATPVSLNHIAPVVSGQTVEPTRNICGWYRQQADATHSSWRSTYTSLGWTPTSIPDDCQTVFNISTSTMKWMSERLAGINGLKLHGSKQLTLSNQGSALQAQFLFLDHHDRADILGTRDHISNRKGSLHTDFALGSRYGMDDKLLAPSFSFGYRLRRDQEFSKMNLGNPTYFGISRFDPWIFFKSEGTSTGRQNIPTGWRTDMNESFEYGSARTQLNTARFVTHELTRSVGLDAAVVLAHA
uniref:Putative coat protein n=1 Tax=Penicillium aurantiogriseum partiti-like virus 1 TaxID=2030912 RepID=A0A286N7A5_9VIRU|nr:putative coat protein [Penicillium aurantiogriseum partiti-like virus 1]